MRRRGTGRESGFSLVEVLVVIGIIAVLAAILFPVLQSARGKAHETACAGNLHQLGLALDMYLQDHDERFPASYVADALGSYTSWRDDLQPYVRNRDVLVCPASEHRGEKLAELTPERQGSYALNAWLSPPDRQALGGQPGVPAALGEVSEAAGTVALCDAGYSNAPVALDYAHYAALGMQEQPLPTERHLGSANFAFVDGHVRRMTEAATRSPEYLWDLD